MPNMDGLEFLAEQECDPITSATSVIVVAAGKPRAVLEGPVVRAPLDVGKLGELGKPGQRAAAVRRAMGVGP